MKCLEIQHRMAAFIENQLDERDTEEFVAHIEGCESCREELAIQYLITEGMRRLEDGSAFDLNKELEEKLQLTLKRMRYKKKFFSVWNVFVACRCYNALVKHSCCRRKIYHKL